MVLEVLSDSSEEKDLITLHQAYWDAGVREYWLVDARMDALRFDIYYHASKGFALRRKKASWVKSEVFGKSFRLTQSKGSHGHPEFTLHVR
jgi:Uma2 family endonuclease